MMHYISSLVVRLFSGTSYPVGFILSGILLTSCMKADELLLWNGEIPSEIDADNLVYGAAAPAEAPETGWYFAGTPDLWHAPGIQLQDEVWRVDLSDYDEIRFWVRTSVAGYSHGFSVHGWYMGGSVTVPIENYVEGGVLDTYWREAVIPIADLMANGCSLGSVEYLYFGTSESDHTIEIDEVWAVTSDAPEPLASSSLIGEVIWDGSREDESDPSNFKYGVPVADASLVSGWYFEGSPDPWHSPGIKLRGDYKRMDLSDAEEIRFWIRSSLAGVTPELSAYGWHMGGSASVPIANYVTGGNIDANWREAVVPVAELKANGCLMDSIEYLYFGKGEANHTVDIANVRCVEADWAPPVDEGDVDSAPPVPYTSEAWLQDLEGNAPIERPLFSGVEQLLVLSNKWVIVVVDPFDDFVAQMDLLTSGEYSETMADVEDAIAREHQTDVWVHRAKLEKMRWEHLVTARQNGSEPLMPNTDFYTLSSTNDTSYAVDLEPSRVTTSLISNDDSVSAGYDAVRYGIYAYIEMPQAMQDGKSYTITLDDGKYVSFVFDDDATVARSIKINQVGYQEGKSSNYAYVGAYLQEFGPLPLDQLTSFDVVDSGTGAVVYQGSLADGKITLRDDASLMDASDDDDGSEPRPSMNGEKLYQLDLTGLTTPGNYYIRVPGVGRSWPFRVNDDVYGEAFYTAMRGLYHQRASFALEAQYTAWTRPRYHTDPIYESQMLPYWADMTKAILDSTQKPVSWPRFDIIGATTVTSQSTTEVDGGWYDAADYDRNLYHYVLIFDLLKLYEFAPAKYSDGQLNIPESGNGIPDLLDEVEYGLRIWKHSQRADGGVSGIVETSTHPSIDDDTVLWSFAQRTRWSSLIYAAAAAELARALEPFDAALAQTYELSALSAYAYGVNPANTLNNLSIAAASSRGEGDPYSLTFTEEANFNDKFELMARVQLFLLSEDVNYLDGIEALYANSPAPYSWPYTDRDFSPWLYFDLAYHPLVTAQTSYVSPATQAAVAADLMSAANRYAAMNDSMPYRMSWPRRQDYWMSWGASDMTNRAKVMLIGNQIQPSSTLVQSSESNLAYMLGANPMGMSWTTGIGFAYPVSIQHESSMTDDILDPYPGITIYGNTSSHVFPELRNRVYKYPTAKDSDGEPLFKSDHAADFATFYELPEQYPVFRRWAAHPSLNVTQNEFTIHETNSSTIFVLGMLMEEGWMPSESLKQRGPRNEEDLFGYWYLP
ncbi:glycoside hydrolase family 9 protein [Coraliomargarita sp. SDUM461003]|uniref:Glycoside hydrolase family 9 protein n=1 Tax=Thalassobacterium maritimum TaxID=3041265 RepID=A0ABU1AVL0_9BACT|nr:glycoside hydrolase family 9 protein [Coraliomargarita sp. SDUM461003]MDQ8208182.1 glycoside hydrolase family 9 protein [Coraliomargarita sp. SDUM461003]